MRVSARLIKGVVLSLILLLLTGLFAPTLSSVHAQMPSPSGQTLSPTPIQTNPYTKPYTDNNVPQNQHILTQAVLIEVLAAIGCQLSGIDLVSPSKACLGINPQTEKLGFTQQPTADGQPQVGGLLGVAAKGIGIMYTPTYSTGDYVNYMAGNFGIAKSAYAADGFTALNPVLGLWQATRNIAYFLLTVAFIFIGIGVMLRIRIDPRTVMTVQNKIPDVIIAIILITFSYAFSGLMVDLMWTTTYIGINTITAQANPEISDCSNNTQPTLNSKATGDLLESPLYFVDTIFLTETCGVAGGDLLDSGIVDLAFKVGIEVAGLEEDLLLALIGVDPNEGSCSLSEWVDEIPVVGAITGGGEKNCPRIFFGNIFGFFASILWFIILFIVIIITLFRIWFELLKAYAVTLMYVILGPIFIVMGLLPKKPLGFERWIRVSFANLVIFPATVVMLVLARAFMWLFSANNTTAAGVQEGAAYAQGAIDPLTRFVPPLVGAPNLEGFGALLGFAVLLMTPQVTSLIKEKLSVPPLKQAAAIGAAIAAGRATAAAPVQKSWQHVNRRNPQTGAPLGIVASLKHDAGKKLTRAIPVIGGRIGAQQDYQEKAYRRGSQQEIRKAGIDQRSSGQKRQDNNNFQAAHNANPQILNTYTRGDDGARRWSLEQQHEQQRRQYNDPRTPQATRDGLARSMEKLAEEIQGMGNRGLTEATIIARTPRPQAPQPPQAGAPTTETTVQGRPITPIRPTYIVTETQTGTSGQTPPRRVGPPDPDAPDEEA